MKVHINQVVKTDSITVECAIDPIDRLEIKKTPAGNRVYFQMGEKDDPDQVFVDKEDLIKLGQVLIDLAKELP